MKMNAYVDDETFYLRKRNSLANISSRSLKQQLQSSFLEEKWNKHVHPCISIRTSISRRSTHNVYTQKKINNVMTPKICGIKSEFTATIAATFCFLVLSDLFFFFSRWRILEAQHSNETKRHSWKTTTTIIKISK